MTSSGHAGDIVRISTHSLLPLIISISTSQNGDWTCGISKVCPSLSCSEEEKVFEPGQCCPRCGPLQELAGAGAACL